MPAFSMCGNNLTERTEWKTQQKNSPSHSICPIFDRKLKLKKRLIASSPVVHHSFFVSSREKKLFTRSVQILDNDNDDTRCCCCCCSLTFFGVRCVCEGMHNVVRLLLLFLFVSRAIKEKNGRHMVCFDFHATEATK